MPIYEFYCAECHRLFSFLSRTMDTSRQPACPKCEKPGLQRRASAFAISKGRPDKPEGEAGEPQFPDLDDSRLEEVMGSLAKEAEGLDEDDPRQQARLMRKLFGATGMPVGAGMEEALKRLEAGEDPETVEQDMGDVFEGADPFGGPRERGPALQRLRRQLPPSVDPTLYEM